MTWLTGLSGFQLWVIFQLMSIELAVVKQDEDRNAFLVFLDLLSAVAAIAVWFVWMKYAAWPALR